ncbi:MAG TPA: DinB family protein [Terracidiphilus sp.]|nr:DinB family protein [Terracidiphilus sp.]
MKTLILSSICLACLLNTGAMDAQAPATTDTTAPSYDMKAQALLDLQAVNQKCVQLAQALPGDKLTWRPSPDTRSFAEVFLHVAGERYAILSLMGAVPPAGFKPRDFEKSTTDRDRIVESLNQSWDFANKTINGMSNADFAKPLPKLGPQANDGDVVYILVADAHEHLGQLIAYARQNGVTPPLDRGGAEKEGSRGGRQMTAGPFGRIGLQAARSCIPAERTRIGPIMQITSRLTPNG